MNSIPLILQEALKRKCVGIWHCKGCGKTVAGGAWVVRYMHFHIADRALNTYNEHSVPVLSDCHRDFVTDKLNLANFDPSQAAMSV